MPTYEYQCEKCGHEFELFESINASKTKTCPSCGNVAKRLIGTGAAVIFKGERILPDGLSQQGLP